MINLRLIRYAISLLIILSASLPFSITSWASCSPYIGQATLNEVYNGTGSNAYTPFIEIKVLDNSIGLIDESSNAVLKPWSLYVCKKPRNQNSDPDCQTFPIAQSTSNPPWIVTPDTDLQHLLDMSKGVNILLRDENGEDVDYLSIAGYDDNRPQCFFEYATDFFASPNSFILNRVPDGTGPWVEKTGGNSSDPTIEDSNNGDVSASCSGVFASGLQNFTTAGSIVFSNSGDSQVIDDPDGILETTDLTIENPSAALTCGDVGCLSMDELSVPLAQPTFRTSNGTTDVERPQWFFIFPIYSFSLGSDGHNEYDEITLRDSSWFARGILNDSGLYTEYRINTLNLGSGAEVNLRGGVDYWIETLNFTSSPVTINVVGEGTARLFVKNSVSVSSGTQINVANGDASQLLIYAYNDLTVKWSGTEIHGLIYSLGDVELQGAAIYGAVAAAGEINLKGTTVNYRSDAAQNAELGLLCDATTTGVDHYRIEHDATGITCQASTVTLRACTNDDCSSEYGGSVTVTLAPATANPPNWIGGDTRTFAENTHVLLQQTSPATLTLGLTNLTPLPANASRCYKNGVEGDCQIVFNTVGVFIDGDSDATQADTPIVTQIAGKPSNSAPAANVFQVRVLRTDDKSGACVASLVDNPNALFRYLVPEVTNGLADNSITLTSSIENQTLESVGNGKELELEFNGDGAAAFWLTSVDAGKYQLQVDMDIFVTDTDGNPLTDDEGNPTGETIHVSDLSNSFVVRPLAVFADAVGNMNAQDAGGGAYKKAGETFSLSFKGLAWTTGRDADNDGQWNSCGSPSLADPGSGYVRVPQWDLGQPTSSLMLPSGGDSGTLDYDGGSVTIAAGETGVSNDNISYSQVGIIQLEQNGINDFLGQNVQVCSPYIGRFYPDHFALTQGALVTRVNSSCTSASTFTYFDEALQIFYELTAKNSLDETTTNYVDAFAKFAGTGAVSYGSTASYTVGAVDDPDGIPTLLSSRLEIENSTKVNDWSAGQARFSVELNIDRDATADGPFTDTRFGVYVQDSDGVEIANLDLDVDDDTSMDHAQSSSSASLRYGRVRLENAHGSEMLDLPVLMQAEYWNGSGFSLNVADSCSSFAESSLTLTSDVESNVAGDTPIKVRDSVTTSTTIHNQPLNNGAGDLELSAPGSGGDGWVDVELTVPDYLKFSWHGSGDENPTSRATFGIYQGNQHIIYIRETTWR